MSSRRRTGQLEQSVLAYLWAVDEASTPAEVHAAVAPDLAYTTVMTVLTRLHRKGRVERERAGRAYAYRAVDSEAEHRATLMHDHLDEAPDQRAVLSRFVETLTTDEALELRGLLGDLDS